MPRYEIHLELPTAIAETISEMIAFRLGTPAQVTPLAGDRVAIIAGSDRLDSGLSDALGVWLANLDVIRAPLQTRVDGGAWQAGWRAWFSTATAAARFVIVPAWESDAVETEADQVLIRIDPGFAFGSGAHPSTQLALQLLADAFEMRPPGTLLDVGCGGGILSIAGARCDWLATGVDIEQLAIDAAAHNVALNAVEDRVVLVCGRVATLMGQFDLTVANVPAFVHGQLAAEIRRKTRVVLVLAGFQTTEAETVLAHYPGFTVQRRVATDGWEAALLLSDAVPL